MGPCFVEALRGNLVRLKALKISVHAWEFRQSRYGVEAEGFEHSIIGSIRDDEDAHSRRTVGELAMGGRTGQPDMPQRAARGSKSLVGFRDRRAGRCRNTDRGISVSNHCQL